MRTLVKHPRFRLLVAVIIVLMLVSLFVVFMPVRSRWDARHAVGNDASGYRYLVLGNPQDVVTETRPGVVLKGGGTDLDEAFQWMIRRSGGGDFLVVRSGGTDAYNDYIYDMTAPGGKRADSVATLIVTKRSASSDPFVIQKIREAEAIWIAGGDQGKHLDMWRGTPAGAAIQELIDHGVPIGGTSAGLDVLGEYSYSAEADTKTDRDLSSSQALRDPHHPRIMIRGDFLHLPFLNHTLLDSHFVNESRHGRMAVFLSRLAAINPEREARGIGIDRRTALLVEPDGSAQVITDPNYPLGTATFFRLNHQAEVCEPGHPLTVTKIEATEFRRGDRLSLSHWGTSGGRVYWLSVNKGVVSTTPHSR